MTQHEQDLEELRKERAHNAHMAVRHVMGPHGVWILRDDWIKHMRKLQKRAEQSPQWAP